MPAERYNEQVSVVERTCVKQGHAACQFEIRFFPSTQVYRKQETTEQLVLQREKQNLANLLLGVLPDADGITLTDLQKLLEQRRVHPQYLRPSKLVEALQQLQHIGLVSSTANQRKDLLMDRRYWRSPTSDTSK